MPSTIEQQELISFFYKVDKIIVFDDIHYLCMLVHSKPNAL